MSRTTAFTSRLGLALVLAALTSACSKDAVAPTSLALAADKSQNTASENAASRSGDDQDSDENEGDDDRPFSYAVFGDFPYGVAKRADMPLLVDKMNADATIERVLHTGDIKAGSAAPCTDAYFADIKSQFDRINDPFVYTPGDNEWTDCHQDLKTNGLYVPTERLIAVRNVFFPTVGRTMGVNAKNVTSQGKVDFANRAYVENVSWTRADIVFATLNITGGNDDLDSWGSTFPANVASYPTQAAERITRAQANNAWLDRAFSRARSRHAKAIVLMFQADMWDNTSPLNGYDAYVKKIGDLAAAFGKPVLLIMGDSHIFDVAYPFTPSSPLFGIHANTPIATNVTRLVVNGKSARTEYVRLTINPEGKTPATMFSFAEVPLN